VYTIANKYEKNHAKKFSDLLFLEALARDGAAIILPPRGYGKSEGNVEIH